jgi:hypothetical protein
VGFLCSSSWRWRFCPWCGAVLALYFSARDADTRIAGANERASSAVERAAALEKEAAEARLKLALLQKQVGPRVIDRDALLNELKGKRKPGKISILWSRAAEDGWYVATQLQRLLVEAEWPVDAEGPVAIDTDSPFLRDKPGIGTGSAGSGIMILFAPNGVDLKDDSGPFVALTQAIAVTLGSSGGVGSDTTLSPGQLRLVIFPRPLTFPRAPGFP